VEGDNSREHASLRSREEVEALIESAEDLTSRVARHLKSCGVVADEDELLAFGRQGLVEAAHRFDPDVGQDFRRFAYFRVRGAMLDGVRKMGDWSRRGYERIALLRGATALGEGRDEVDTQKMSASEAAQRLSKHMAAVTTAMTVGVFAEHVHGKDGAIEALDGSASTEDLIAERQMSRLVREAMESLPPPEDEIIRSYYVEGEKMDVIADRLGKSKSWVSRAHTKAIARLGARLRGV
jgi:RNA polymerase sigma factor for flagellar operon FliA